MYDHTLYLGRKHFCCYFLHAFSAEEILKRHIKDCFKISRKQRIIQPKTGECVNESKIKSPFIIYVDFESILGPEDDGKQNPEDSYTNKYQKQIACSYGYNLVCVDDKFSKPFKTYLGKDAVYKFINNMIEESKYCSEAIRNILRKNS